MTNRTWLEAAHAAAAPNQKTGANEVPVEDENGKMRGLIINIERFTEL
ncbi:MAG: hypothetical protein U1G07_07030 [Verrucomicrobiota bacterium]